MNATDWERIPNSYMVGTRQMTVLCGAVAGTEVRVGRCCGDLTTARHSIPGTRAKLRAPPILRFPVPESTPLGAALSIVTTRDEIHATL